MENDIFVGIPAKKRKFDIVIGPEYFFDCYLENKTLYLFCSKHMDNDCFSGRIKVVDLSSYTGEVSKYLDFYYSDQSEGAMLRYEAGYFLLSGSLNVILDKNSGHEIFSDAGSSVGDGWGSGICSFIVGDQYIRQIEKEIPSKGADIYDLVLQKVVGHLDFDLKIPHYIGRNLIFGRMPNGNAGIFSIEKNALLCEIDCLKYFGGFPYTNAHHSVWGDKLALAYNHSVIVLDLKTLEIVHHINCLEVDPTLNSASLEYEYPIYGLSIQGISFVDNFIILYGGKKVSFVLSIDITNEEKPIQWVHLDFQENYAEYIGGDLIFGIEQDRPVAWDFYSGEKVWTATANVLANKIQIGDGWVTYSYFSGYIQCFQWKKPYISPHRPAIK